MIALGFLISVRINYRICQSQLIDLAKQKNGLEDKINSLSAQIDTLEKQQD